MEDFVGFRTRGLSVAQGGSPWGSPEGSPEGSPKGSPEGSSGDSLGGTPGDSPEVACCLVCSPGGSQGQYGIR